MAEERKGKFEQIFGFPMYKDGDYSAKSDGEKPGYDIKRIHQEMGEVQKRYYYRKLPGICRRRLCSDRVL